MKFNKQGEAIQRKWFDIWDKAVELEVAEKGEARAEYGSSAIEMHGFINSADDEMGYLFAEDQECAIDHILDCCFADEQGTLRGWLKLNDEWAFGVSCRDMILKMMPYFDMTEEERVSILRDMNALSAHHSKVKVRKHLVPA